MKGSSTGGCTQTPEHILAEIIVGVAEFLQQLFTTLINMAGTFASTAEEECQMVMGKGSRPCFQESEGITSSHALAHFDQDLPLIL